MVLLATAIVLLLLTVGILADHDQLDQLPMWARLAFLTTGGADE